MSTPAPPAHALPDGPLVAWYGDDFTGAAATMEVLAFAGLPSLLFLDIPTAAQLARHPGLRGIGVASTARTEGPDWMRAELPGVFARLAALNPGLLHYKICSTLDSSPQAGSIGTATELGCAATGARLVPLLVAAPQMGRYQVFGQLFAAHDGTVHRLDRHPVMSRHPVTPMDEADVARHVARQSDRFTARALTMGRLQDRPPAPFEGADLSLLTLDCWDADSEAMNGALLWNGRAENPFVVGSQGVEYALVAHWRAQGLIVPARTPQGIGRAGRMVSVSGSVSPTTADQIAWSRANGFTCIPFDATTACHGTEAAEEARVTQAALDALSAGQDPLIVTAEGPDDPAVQRFREAVAATGADIGETNRRIGEALGRVLSAVLTASQSRRAVISGGDTSGHATRQLGIHALSVLAPTVPGASIFRAHGDGAMEGLELALKGGQMGSADYFGWVRDGGGPR